MATTTKQRGLGKGLSALISENYSQAAPARTKPAPASSGINTVAVGKLHEGGCQPRTHFDQGTLAELAESIAKNGIVQPIIVRPSSQQGRYEIIAGERRWRAAKMAGLSELQVIVRDLSDQQALEFALVENIQRQDLSPLEEAMGFQRLIDEFDYTQEALAAAIGKSRSHIANLLRLQSLPGEVKAMLEKGQLTMGHARALLTAENPVALAREIVKNSFSVRQIEQYRSGKSTAKKPATTGKTAVAPASDRPKDPDIIALEESLSENLKLKVSINDRGNQGEIVLAYESLAQLDDILKRLNNSAGI